MANITKLMGRHRDLPQLESQPFASLSAGSASDLAAGSEIQMAALPDLRFGFPPSAAPGQGADGALPLNRMVARWAAFCAQGTADVLGNATNYADLQLLLYRWQASGLLANTNPGTYLQGILGYYTLGVNTTAGGAIAANPGVLATVTPAAMTNIADGLLLAVDPPQAAPGAVSATGNTGTGSSFTGAQTVKVSQTFVTAAGESVQSAVDTVTISASGDNVVVTLPTFPTGVTGMNVYASVSSGSTTLYRVGTGVSSTTSGGTVTLTNFPANTNPSPPAADSTGSAFELVMVSQVTATTFAAAFSNAHASTAQVCAVLPPNYPVPFVRASGVANTSFNSSPTAGTSVVVTPLSMYGIHVGDTLLLDSVASGVQESVVVQAVTTTTFTATIAHNHSTGTTHPIVTANDKYGIPLLANGADGVIQPGDVLKLTRTSNNATGLATPAGNFFLDWVPSGVRQ